MGRGRLRDERGARAQLPRARERAPAAPRRRARRRSTTGPTPSRRPPADRRGRPARPAACAASRRCPNPASVKVHLVLPRSFNDAQQIADRFKDGDPGDPQPAERRPELSKRLIDFASGLTYALDGGMQRVADKVFLLTPRNVEVSAEERAQHARARRLLQPGVGKRRGGRTTANGRIATLACSRRRRLSRASSTSSSRLHPADPRVHPHVVDPAAVLGRG